MDAVPTAGQVAGDSQAWPGQVTERTLADGRPVLYFDDEATGTPVHEAVDVRPLPEPPHAGEMRFDVLTGEWVTIAGHRMNRTFLPSAADCPLDPTRDAAHATEVPDSRYDVVVFANRFPSFAPLTVGPDPDAPPPPFGPADRPAYGHCDVVVFSSDHDAAVVDLPTTRMRTIVEAWAERTAAHSADPDVAEVFVFENSGQEIGVTLTHPHGQVYAYPVVPPRSSTSRSPGCGPSWRPGPSAPPPTRPTRRWPRCSCSTTAARRSG